MIRLLYLAPVIAIIGAIMVTYMIFFRPIVKNSKGQSLTASVAINEIKDSIKKFKEQQDILGGSMTEQRDDLIKQSTSVAKLYEQANREEYQDFDLFKLKEAINEFNGRALELAGNETAIIKFNDQLREGIAGIDRQVKDIDIADLLRPKEDLANRLTSLKIQVSQLVEMQKAIIEKSREYNNRARDSVENIHNVLLEQSAAIAAMKTDKTGILEIKIQEILDNEKEVLSRIKERQQDLAEMRQQNLDQMKSSKERVSQLMEQMRDRMDEVHDKIEDNTDKLRVVKDKMNDAKERAQAAKERAEDMKQALRERMHK